MKYLNKLVKEMHIFQRIIYEYLKKEVNDDGINFMDILIEIEEGFEYIPDDIYNAFSSLSSIERIEVIHFFTKYIIKNG